MGERATWSNEEAGCIRFHCPGCDYSHFVYTKGPVVWVWNERMDLPTFIPSILTWRGPTEQDGRCHSFVTDGRIQFLSDCTHPLAGQTMDLPELEGTDGTA